VTGVGTDVLVVGESVVDVIEHPDGSRAAHPGGSPANVAFGLARLGIGTTFLTQLGRDADAELIRGHLGAAGVALVDAGPDATRTPRSTARIGEDGSARYDFAISWDLGPAPAIPRATHVHTGSVAAFLAPGADTVGRVLAGVRATSTISLDPNIRPELLPDHGGALDRFERLLPLTDVVKASDEDLAWLYPGQDPTAVARRILGAGVALVVITRGAHGALAATAGATFVVAPVPATVVDTVGAGDSFMAALLDGLHRAALLGPAARRRLRTAGESRLEPHLRRAARAAAITVSRAGAHPPTAAELTDDPR
jgi:fructokinase